MPDRRTFNVGLALASLSGLSGCAGTEDEYLAASRQLWRQGPLQGLGGRALGLELLRYASLAPSSHNTQCWRFELGADAITLLPDFDRRCPVVDPDDHHLYVSLGCAAENLIQAAAARACGPSPSSMRPARRCASVCKRRRRGPRNCSRPFPSASPPAPNTTAKR